MLEHLRSFPSLTSRSSKCLTTSALTVLSSVSQVKSNQTPLSLSLFLVLSDPSLTNYHCLLLLSTLINLSLSLVLDSSHPKTSSFLMGSISHVITTNPTLPHLPFTRSTALRFSCFNPRFLRLPPTGVAGKVGVFAEVSSPSRTTSAIDFSDPDWKTKFQQDWEARFRLPHLTDIFPDAPPIPSTFCLKMRLVGWQVQFSFLYPLFATTETLL